MLDRETWDFINSFAPWLAALGTIAAVVTSLYLARRSDRISLELSLGIRILVVQGGGPGHSTEFVSLTVTNLGRRAGTLIQLFWKIVPWRGGGFIWVAPENAVSSPLPITLHDGESANYAEPVAEFHVKLAEGAGEHFAGRAGWLRLQFVRFKVTTSTGHTFSTRPEKSLRNLLREMAHRPASEDQ